MKERVLLFDRSRMAIAELDLSIQRTWHVDRVARGRVSINAMHPKFDLMQLGRYIHVLSEYHEAFTGFLWLPVTWRDGTVTFTLYGCEQLLSQRITGANDIYSDVGGSVMTSLLAAANATEATGISVGNVSTDGGSVSRTYHYGNVLDAINKLATDVSKEFWVTGTESGGVLSLLANWGTRGGAFAGALHEGGNLTDLQLTEEGDVANSITAYGQCEDWSNAQVATSTDTDSKSVYGLIEDTVAALDTSDATTLATMAAAHLGKRKQHRWVVTADYYDTVYPNCGDTASVYFTKTGRVNNGLGGLKTMRIQAIGYDPADMVTTLTLREVA